MRGIKVGSDVIVNTISGTEYLAFIKSIVTVYEKGYENKYFHIKKDLKILEGKIEDDSLYLGAVGAFSSGKSTFINSVIHKNLLPTDAVQGTTVAASVLKKAEYDDLEIVYNDEKIMRLSENQDEMLLRYQVEGIEERSLSDECPSIFKRIVLWIKRLFGISQDAKEQQRKVSREICIKMFKKIISTEEIASDVKCVTLYYQNESIPHKIALVDTPGTESINKRHNDVTKNAIESICDAIVVIIPYDEPVSEELLSYVNENLAEQKSDCIYVVTKVELLGDRDELPRLLRVIKRRLENGLEIESACVIPMPTLIYLKSVDAEMQTTFLDDISESDKEELIAMYEDGIAKIIEVLETNKSRFIRSKIITICERVSMRLNENLMETVNDYEERNQLLQGELVKPIVEFEELADKEIIDYCDISAKRMLGDLLYIQLTFSKFNEMAEKAINDCNDSQQLLIAIDFNLNDVLTEIQNMVLQRILEFQNGLNSKLNEMVEKFEEFYRECGIDPRIGQIENVGCQLMEESFLSESEDLMQETIREVRSTIESDTSGLFKKMRSFFSNPINRHKEMAWNSFFDVMETICQDTKSYVSERITKIVLENGENAQMHLEKMIEDNRGAIETDRNCMLKEMEENARRKADIVACMDKLRQYIAQMKEVG